MSNLYRCVGGSGKQDGPEIILGEQVHYEITATTNPHTSTFTATEAGTYLAVAVSDNTDNTATTSITTTAQFVKGYVGNQKPSGVVYTSVSVMIVDLAVGDTITLSTGASNYRGCCREVFKLSGNDVDDITAINYVGFGTSASAKVDISSSSYPPSDDDYYLSVGWYYISKAGSPDNRGKTINFGGECRTQIYSDIVHADTNRVKMVVCIANVLNGSTYTTSMASAISSTNMKHATFKIMMSS